MVKTVDQCNRGRQLVRPADIFEAFQVRAIMIMLIILNKMIIIIFLLLILNIFTMTIARLDFQCPCFSANHKPEKLPNLFPFTGAYAGLHRLLESGFPTHLLLPIGKPDWHVTGFDSVQVINENNCC